LAEFYAIAFDFAQKAVQRYGELAARDDDGFAPLRRVFEVLVRRERDRAATLATACRAACGKPPDASDLRWPPLDLVQAAELAEVGNSGLSTAYTAWALAVRQGQRAFVFWTYVVALAEDTAVRQTAEGLAREALDDGNLLRRERRAAWRTERRAAADAAAKTGATEQPESAALLESLLLRDMMSWAQGLDPARRRQLLTLGAASLPEPLPPADGSRADEGIAEIEQIKRRALRRAEQLSNIYLDEADRAADQSGMELAQKLAGHSIMRLAGLRQLAAESGWR
ncbi:MAG: hypothetical protein WA418_00980, partial [Bradyrhizobium sp.]